ncbi:MAG: biopolymer transporter ExbD [Azoarcus sp.]|nr:biopolymer transporter ExbD [Azoarcus sp.]
MAFHPQAAYRRPPPEINMIPLIDVMLVLLTIFIVAAPLLTHAVKIDLPAADSAMADVKPDTIQLGIKADGRFFWNGIDMAGTELETSMREAARREPRPELHIQADSATPYGMLARVMALASRAGLEKIGFVSKPGADE